METKRAFAVNPLGEAIELVGTEERLRHMGCSPALSAAYDILKDNGAATQDVLKLCVAAEKSGNDPEAFARHFVKLAKATKEHDGSISTE